MRKDTPGMSFDAYAGRIMSLHEHETVEKRPQKKVQKCFQVKSDIMKMTSISKCQSVGLNNKRYYFSDWIVAFPYGQPCLEEIIKYEKEVKDKMQKWIKKTNLKYSELKLRQQLRVKDCTFEDLLCCSHLLIINLTLSKDCHLVNLTKQILSTLRAIQKGRTLK